jgi:hypothetical protein
MAVTPDSKRTLVLSPAASSIAIIDNTTNGVAAGTSTISLPGSTESIVISANPTNADTDEFAAYVAIFDAPVPSSPRGLVDVINTNTGAITASMPVSGARRIVQSHNGERLLVFGDTAEVTVIDPSKIGTNTDPRTSVCCFDHPVYGVFSSDDAQAYILECGPECGGAVAAVTVLDLSNNTPGTPTPLPAAGATVGLLSGSTLYVAGTPPNAACDPTTALCGVLTSINASTLAISGSKEISDGTHDRMEVAQGQLFIGARSCTNVNIPASGNTPAVVRGCLSIFNTSSSSVVLPPDNGDVTGIQPIPDRDVVYVVEDGELRIYDTTTAALQDRQVDIIGQAVDVKFVDAVPTE